MLGLLLNDVRCLDLYEKVAPMTGIALLAIHLAYKKTYYNILKNNVKHTITYDMTLPNFTARGLVGQSALELP